MYLKTCVCTRPLPPREPDVLRPPFGRGHPSDRVAETLDFLGIADLADRRVGEFSKGCASASAWAQAMLHGPKVLFLDEPTPGSTQWASSCCAA